MFYCRTKISLCSNEIPMALHRDKVGDAEDDSNTICKDLKLNQWSRRIDLCVSFKSLQSLYSLHTCIPCSEVLTSTYIEEHNCFSKDTWIYVLAWISKLSWIEPISLCKLDSDLSLILQNLAILLINLFASRSKPRSLIFMSKRTLFHVHAEIFSAIT